MKNTLIFALCAFIFILSSCQSKEEPASREQALSKGFRMMDHGDYDSAISYFSDLALKDPHYHVKMALASAYAGRAGVKLEQIYSFVVVKNVTSPELHFRVGALDKQTSDLMNVLARYAEQWNRVPVVSINKSRDLRSALQVLQSVSESGACLYGATLRVVLIKSSLNEGLASWREMSSQRLCSENLRPYFDWGVRIVEELIFLANDLQNAFPDKAAQYREISLRLSQIKKDAEAPLWPRENLCF